MENIRYGKPDATDEDVNTVKIRGLLKLYFYRKIIIKYS